MATNLLARPSGGLHTRRLVWVAFHPWAMKKRVFHSRWKDRHPLVWIAICGAVAFLLFFPLNIAVFGASQLAPPSAHLDWKILTSLLHYIYFRRRRTAESRAILNRCGNRKGTPRPPGHGETRS